MPTEINTWAVLGVGAVSIGTLVWTIYERVRSGAGTLRREIDEDNAIRRKQLEDHKKELEQKVADGERHCAEQVAEAERKSLIEINILSKELAAFKATIEEKDKHIASLTLILQGKNPEILEVLTEIKDFMKKLNEKQDVQTGLLEKGQKRSDRIDEASVKKEGEIMRVPDGATIKDKK